MRATLAMLLKNCGMTRTFLMLHWHVMMSRFRLTKLFLLPAVLFSATFCAATTINILFCT